MPATLPPDAEAPGPPSHYVTPLDPTVAEAVALLDDNAREFFEERAAVIEFEAHVPRFIAERRALAEVRALFRLRQD